jgi:hypothetical protein
MDPVGMLLAFSPAELKSRLLRITQTETETERRWTLCGRVAGPSVAVLRACWEHDHQARDGVRRLLDLRDVTFIDESGEELLSEMRSSGAEFVAAGVATKHLVESLGAAGSTSVTVYKSARQPRSRKHGALPETGGTHEKSA